MIIGFIFKFAGRAKGAYINTNMIEICTSRQPVMEAFPQEIFYFVGTVEFPYPTEVKKIVVLIRDSFVTGS